jgi:2-isopropylmalate synthase
MFKQTCSAQDVVSKLVPDGAKLCGILAKVERLKGLGVDLEMAEASLRLFILQELGRRPAPFRVTSYHISLRADLGVEDLLSVVSEVIVPPKQFNQNEDADELSESEANEAIVKGYVGARRFREVAEGDGAIHALDAALRKALLPAFPFLEKVSLTDYSVKLLNGNEGTAGTTSALVESTDGTTTWRTIGVHKNVNRASLMALIDSLIFAIMMNHV